MKTWVHKTLGHGDTWALRYGDMRTQGHGDIRHWDLSIWGHEDKEHGERRTWETGTWGHGDIGKQGHEDMDT